MQAGTDSGIREMGYDEICRDTSVIDVGGCCERLAGTARRAVRDWQDGCERLSGYRGCCVIGGMAVRDWRIDLE